MNGNSLYIHIPFCIHRCGYCDFNTYAGLQGLIPAYSQALCAELEYLSQSVKGQLPIHTIYFGGGTPSLVPANQLAEILSTVKDYFNLQPSPEITLEANPGTVSCEYLSQVHRLGINRISFGMQSADQNELALLDRQHIYEDVLKAVRWSRKIGIDNLNLDLIFGLPSQTLNSWLKSVETAIALQPEHLSLYSLTLEHGTPLQRKVKTGILPEPDPDTAADMYEAASERLAKAGYIQYEISNWALANKAGDQYSCKHNLQYWRNLPYLGVGAGAHGYINHYRTVNSATPGAYIRRMGKKVLGVAGSNRFPNTPATINMNHIDTDTEIGETMMMGLRLVLEGVSNQDFLQRFGKNLQEVFGNQIDCLISIGLLEWTGAIGKRLRLTKKGYLLGNQVFKEFI